LLIVHSLSSYSLALFLVNLMFDHDELTITSTKTIQMFSVAYIIPVCMSLGLHSNLIVQQQHQKHVISYFNISQKLTTMLKRIRHSLRCFPRRRCDCHDDSQPSGARPNRPVGKAPRRALRQPLPKNVVKGAAAANQPRGSEDEEGSEDEDSSDDY
jgi:hypothetical protein